MRERSLRYPWLICGCAMLVLFCNVGLVSEQAALLLPYIIDENAFSNKQASMITTLRGLFNLLAMLVADRWFRRLGLRIGLVLATACAALSMAIYALSHSLASYYLAAAISGIGYGLGAMIPVTLLLANWFPGRLGFFLGLATAGSSICGVIFPPILTMVCENAGLAAAFWLQTAIIFGAAVIIWRFVRDTPKQMGLSPLSAVPAAKAEPASAAAKTGPLLAMCRADQRLMLFALVLAGFIGIAGPSYWAVHFRLSHYTAMMTATAFSLLCAVEIFGKIACGAAMDRFGAVRANYLFFAILIAGTVLITGLTGALLPFYLGVSLTGLGVPITLVGISVWADDLVHRSELPRTVKQYQAATAVGGVIGSPLIGVLADWTGNYRLSYALSALCCVFCLLIVRRMYLRYVGAKRRLPAAAKL